MSDAGDYIGGGQTQRLVFASSSEFTASMDSDSGHLSFRGSGVGGSCSVDLGAPAGGVLTTGVYNGASRWPFYTSYGSGPGLTVNSPGRRCNQLLGRFLIAELVVSGGTIQHLHAVIEQHCEYSSRGLVADLWIDAAGSTSVPSVSLPAPPASPRSLLNFTIFFSAAGSVAPVVGTYTNAASFSTATAPGLFVSPCSVVGNTGTFTVLELAYGPRGPAGDQILRLHLTFEMMCSGDSTRSSGELYIVADRGDDRASDPADHATCPTLRPMAGVTVTTTWLATSYMLYPRTNFDTTMNTSKAIGTSTTRHLSRFS